MRFAIGYIIITVCLGMYISHTDTVKRTTQVTTNQGITKELFMKGFKLTWIASCQDVFHMVRNPLMKKTTPEQIETFCTKRADLAVKQITEKIPPTQ